MLVDRREPLAGGAFSRWWTHRLPPELENRFNAEGGLRRNQKIRFWLFAWLIFDFFNILLDIRTVPDVLDLLLPLRLVVFIPVTCLAIWLLGRPRPDWIITCASAVPPAMQIVTTLLGFALSHQGHLPNASLLLPIAIFRVNALVPMRLNAAVWFTAGTAAAGILVNGPGQLVNQLLHGASASVIAGAWFMVALSLVARFVAERDTRASFLAGLRLSLRNEDLTRANESLLRISSTDPLTGLANRRAFDRALHEAWETARATNGSVAVMMLDLDMFKLFNDTAGHLEGDRCLAIVARAVAEHVRAGRDVAARFGGEEFVVLMPGTALPRAREVAERVHTAILALQLFHPGLGGQKFVTASVGVAAMQPTGKNEPSSLIAAADAALYRAKTSGRNKIILASP